MGPNLMDAEFMLQLYERLLLLLTWTLAVTTGLGVLTYLCLFLVERPRYQHSLTDAAEFSSGERSRGSGYVRQ